MTEVEYVITRFDEKFHTFRGSNIVLHGSREYAESIIDHFNSSYHFIGVMSKEPIEGDNFHGLRILHEEDIPQLGIDMIILTERVKYAEAVYVSISKICRENGVFLYNMYGLDEHRTHDDIQACIYKSAKEWEEICRPYDGIAFEVLDTLSATVTSKWYQRDEEIRPVFLELLPKLMAEGKDVWLSLRKSSSEDRQISILEKSGLFSDLERRLIRRHGEDLSFRLLAEKNSDKKILYIGYGLVNECILPRCYGIDTYRYVAPYSICMAPKPEDDYKRITYTENLKEQVYSAIMKADVVSFDVFDTLIQRMTLFPADVFYIVENKAKAEGLSADRFAQKRIEIEGTLHQPNIYEIYEVLQDMYGWGIEEKQRMIDLELFVERQVITPRLEVVALLKLALAQGKTVVLTSDMYLPGAVLNEILASNGIEGYNKLFVSCDVRQSKYNGLYEHLLSLCTSPEKILHIGNDIEADGKCCDIYGIKNIIIPSALTKACTGNWHNSVDCAETLMERCLMGMTISELFIDPFCNPNLKEVSSEERLRRFAVGVTGPLVVGYMTWLIKKIRENRIDKVLFLARDGYMPERIYRSIHLASALPESIYFLANRHAAFLTCSDEAKAADWVALVCEGCDMNGTDILKRVYGLDEEDILKPQEDETAEEQILRNMPKIKEIAASSRRGYLKYADKCGLRRGEKCAVVDFIAIGSTQMYLERFLQLQLKGYYFGKYNSDETEQCEIDFYLKGENEILLENYIELESFFSAPEPSIERITEDGIIEFQQEVRSNKEIDDMKYVLDRTESFAKLFFELFYEEGSVIRPVLPEEMFAADGYHWVQQTAYDDWLKKKIKTRKWRTGIK